MRMKTKAPKILVTPKKKTRLEKEGAALIQMYFNHLWRQIPRDFKTRIAMIAMAESFGIRQEKQIKELLSDYKVHIKEQV